ncbi:hypothetical protein QYF36_012634 [Acer negundo]|nr:hypothetical protein QYF36_012634 [Acer negundo]
MTDFQVIDGAYDGAQLSCSDQAVLTENGLDKIGYNIPLEIMPSGHFEPLYRTNLECAGWLLSFRLNCRLMVEG